MKRPVKHIAIITVLALAVAACGQRAQLRPEAGAELPPPPYGASQPLDADELLELELRRESEEREDDPFDLPPEA